MSKETCSVPSCNKIAYYNILITHYKPANSNNFLHEYYFCKQHKPIYSVFDDGPFEVKPEIKSSLHEVTCYIEPSTGQTVIGSGDFL